MTRDDGITRTAGLIGFLTLLSRIGGYIRDMAVAYFFGATGATDAFYVAFRIPNLLRRLFAEGSLTVSFIPVFTDYLENKGRDEARRVANATFTVLSMILVAVTILGIVFSSYIVKLFAAGFKPQYFHLAVEMNRMMFPFILLVSLSALAMGVLNSLRHFFTPAISPLLLNLGIITGVLVFHGYLGEPIYSVALGVILGGVLQLFVQLPALAGKGFLFRFARGIFHPAVKRIGLLMAPQVFGLAVYNINIIISTQYASHLPAGTVSYLYYSERLIEFPLGVVAVSIATALLPALSTHAAQGEDKRFRERYTNALRLMLFAILPSLVGLAALRVPICSLLYQRGEFGFTETVYTSQSLLGYLFGLWAVAGVRITAPAFYALGDTKTPVVAAFLSLFVNATFAYALAFPLGLKHFGLALASSISSIFQFLVLFFAIRRRVGLEDLGGTLRAASKITVASLLTGCVALAISSLAEWDGGGASLKKAVVLTGAIFVCVLVYFALSRVLGVKESSRVIDVLFMRGRDKEAGRA